MRRRRRSRRRAKGDGGDHLPSTKVSAVLTLHCNVFCAGELGCKGYRGLLVLAKISGADAVVVVSLPVYTETSGGGEDYSFSAPVGGRRTMCSACEEEEHG